MPDLIPIDGDPFAGYNFRAAVGGPGQQQIAPTPDAPAAQVSTASTSDNAPPVNLVPVDYQPILEQGFPLFSAAAIAGGAVKQLTPVDHDPFAAQLVPVDHNPFTQ